MEEKKFYLNITTLNEEGKKESKTIYVSEEVYRAYKQPYWAEKQQERRASRCMINGHRCMGDCTKCDRLRDGAPLSLEQLTEDGIEVPASYETPEEAMIRKEEYEQLYAAMATLTDRDQKILQLFSDGKSDHAIAAELGMAQTTVSYRRRAALKNLKKLLG
jgi:RNA polymerase sigma factor (sigma-70 family)